MLLNNPFRMDKTCPRSWTATIASALVALAVVLGGVGSAAAQVQIDVDVKKGQVQPAQPGIGLQVEVPEAFQIWEKLQKALDKLRDQKNIDLEEIRKIVEEMRNQPWGRGMFRFGPGGTSVSSRLGVKLTKPGEILAEQLNLPKGQGLVISEVKPNSAAAQAGLKANDLLLKADGKAVPDDVQAFSKNLEGAKPDKGIDLVVLRKGKEETIKGLKVPEAKAPAFGGFGPNVIPGGFFPGQGFPGQGFPGQGFPFAGAGNVVTTTIRTGDRFNTRHQEGNLIITVTGRVADGKAQPDSIHIQDGAVANKYDKVADVPEQHRDKVNRLLQISSVGGLRIEEEKKKRV